MIQPTSLDAYIQTLSSGQLAVRRNQVLVFIRGMESSALTLLPGEYYALPVSQADCERYYKLRLNTDTGRVFGKRFRELVRLGALIEVGTKPDPITGQGVLCYQTTGFPPGSSLDTWESPSGMLEEILMLRAECALANVGAQPAFSQEKAARYWQLRGEILARMRRV